MPTGQQQSISQAQIIDPILTGYVQGYKQSQLVGSELFPMAPVSGYRHQVIRFGNEAFRLYNSTRAMGGATKRIAVGYSAQAIALVLHALETVLPREERRAAAAGAGITNLQQRKLNTVMRALLLELENEQATAARTTGNYDASNTVTVSAGNRWTQAGADILGQVEDARNEIRRDVGTDPNVMVISATAWSGAKSNTAIKDQFKYTSSRSITLEMFAAACEVDRVFVGKAVTKNAAGVATDVWGNDVVLAYVPPSNGDLGADMEEPSYGYTYHTEGHPLVEVPYEDNRHKSEVYGVSLDRQVYVTGMDAGYLIVDAGDDS